MNSNNNDREKIEKTLNCFFEGLDKLDVEKIKSALHPLQRSFCITPDGLCGMYVSGWDKFIEKIKNDPDHSFRRGSKKSILSIDISGNAASAKAELAFSDIVYTDYYNLLKIDDQWYIMNTTYDTRALQDAN
jgi:hypothetical protein